MARKTITLGPADAGKTLAAFLRQLLPGSTWREVRQTITRRQVAIGGQLCVDPARRLKEKETVEILDRPATRPREGEAVTIAYLDRYLVVVQKPAGLATVRHPSERHWPARRKRADPTLQDLVPALIVRREKSRPRGLLPRLRVVQRLDKETSGLVVFARTVEAERGLGRQFHGHTIIRRYLAIISGYLAPQRISTYLVRDRGDGRRGSTSVPGQGKEAITDIQVEERLGDYTVLSCQLQTGRTHQIRIHLSELGHPICGEKVYKSKPGKEAVPDQSGAPRLALHAAELGFAHPITGKAMHWRMKMPADLRGFVERLRKRAPLD
jgi:23S rRNA pseudouridine1911/1915/1917 synthase